MMKSGRLSEFVNYHNNGDGECNGITLKAWADKKALSGEDRIDLCYFFSVTYCVCSAIVMFMEREALFREPEKWAKANKRKIVFQSDRKYARMRDTFERLLRFYSVNRRKIQGMYSGQALDLQKAVPEVEKWPFFGRFSAYLFLETLAIVADKSVRNAEMEWENGQTATSGLLNLLGMDRAADEFDKTGKLPKGYDRNSMQMKAEPILRAIEATGGNPNITMVETSLCAYRKFFKGSRYNGYYLDRMLGEIGEMRKAYPEVANEVLQVRAETFSPQYLGEVMGWSGIRKEMKKLYKEKGIITYGMMKS